MDEKRKEAMMPTDDGKEAGAEEFSENSLTPAEEEAESETEDTQETPGAKKRKPKEDPKIKEAQLRHIEELICSFERDLCPIVSIGSKKRTVCAYRPFSRLRSFFSPDEEIETEGMVIEGIYDVYRNRGYLYLNDTHDTTDFAADCLRYWWIREGSSLYAHATKLLVLGDCAGSTGYRSRPWQLALWDMALDYGIQIYMSHYPPGFAYENPIEDSLFRPVMQAWDLFPRMDMKRACKIARSVTEGDLKVQCWASIRYYDRVSVSPKDRAWRYPKMKLGEFNYVFPPP